MLLPITGHCAAADDAAIDAKVRELLAQMTLEEKVGQLVQYSSPELNSGPEAQTNILKEIAAGRCGSVLNYVGAQQTREIQTIAVTRSRLKIPLLFGYDVIHGFRTIFPMNLGQAASWDLEAIRLSEHIAAVEASASGIHWTFSPMVDIARDPRWGRIAEGSGEDTFLGSAIARARVEGFQGDDLSRPDTILACAKHFAAYGAAQAGRDYWSTEVPEIVLRDVYLPPFRAAVEAGAATFMAAFNDLNGVPCSGNSFLLDKVLRQEWGFKGFVVSDWMSVYELIPHGFAADGKQATLLGFNAGVDMDMMGLLYMKHLPTLVKEGKVSLEKIDAAAAAILRAKARLGLFEDPFRYCDREREKSSLLNSRHLEAARDLARKSFVLLKNDRQTLPLSSGTRIALVGPLADSKRDLIGSWQGQGREEECTSLRGALEALMPGKINYALGCQIQDDDPKYFAAALAAAKKSDVIVAVLGEKWSMCGEGNCRSNLDLPGHQLALLQSLKATGKPVVLVLMAGRPMTIGNALPFADAVLYAWYPGTMGGPALADTLTGAYNPSGKLPVSFPRNVGQIPIYYNSKMSGRPQDDSKPRAQYRSNYLDVANTPEFPFGFGLSYTRFEYRDAALSSPVLEKDGTLTVTVKLANTGAREGEEVVQLYIRDLVGSVTRPVRELKGFSKVSLKAGEQRELRFVLKPADLAFHHADMSFAPEAGLFEVFVGGDSNAPKAGQFELKL
jgi:beta-glucosidase